MLGYVTIEKSELKIREYDVYRGYYCGVCKSIGRRYGQLPRMTLSYDAAFLALLLGSLAPGEDIPAREHCIIHPVKKNPVLAGEAVDYAGDVMLLLAWHKLRDDVRDDKSPAALAGLLPLRRAIRIIRRDRPELTRRVEGQLALLAGLEREGCPSMDRAADCFAKILEAVLALGPGPRDEETKEILGRLGYHLGKWIYLMDAWEDLPENFKKGTYNPLALRYGRDPGESAEAFRERILPQVRWNLMVCLEETGKAVDSLALQKNRGIIENIVYMGLFRRTEAALGKEEPDNDESL
jgi:hypothetical protein